ncbi:MAG: hypothetical protein HYW06_09150 [Gemmatimonadetes bacterium]|nr:hypothetical protein [Gemmatimonadota bacterium]
MDNGKLIKLLVGTAAVAVLFLVAATYLFGLTRNNGEIARLRVEADRVRLERDSIRRVVAMSDSMQQDLRRERDEKEAEAAGLRREVAALERDRTARQLEVRGLRRPDSLKAKLVETFPEMAASDWGVTDIRNEQEDVSVQYLLVPLWFSETFIIEHQNAESWREQGGKLQAVDSLQQRVVSLQDSVQRLEEQKVLALQTGYSNMLDRYEQLNQDFIAELRKPRVSLGSMLGLCVGAAGAGVIAGALVK